MADISPLPTTEYGPWLVANGACFCMPSNILTVPIPLIDVRINDNRQIVWATIQTPFGSKTPLFGIINYAEQNRLPYGAEFQDASGKNIAILADVRAFEFPKHTETKLIHKAQRHAMRLADDMAYRMMWDELYVEFLLGDSF